MNNCYVIQICLKNKKNTIDYDYKLQETINLAEALDLIVVGSNVYSLMDINPATLINKGNLEDLQTTLQSLEVDALIINHPLTAIQQRNLENFLKVKVLDRSGLIINIFANRAVSAEGKLQSNLAALYYQKSRLVKAWSHLERQRGGGGAVGGPGETQKELDRRMIADKIEFLKEKLEKLRQNRSISTNSRKKFNIKTVAIVGYTNSGKSTLFNILTNESVLSQDLLFATLDTTSRIVMLPYKQKAILSDTVGFISDLPHQLVEAFHSTLDGILDADLILHVIDSAQKNYEDQIHSVKTVLAEIGISEEVYNQKVLEVYNKADLLEEAKKDFFSELTSSGNKILISAVDGFNLDLLKQKIFSCLNKDKFKIRLEVSYLDNDLLVYLYNNTTILEKTTTDELITLTLLCQEKDINFIKSKNPRVFANPV
ncbi:MAG: GTPase HflX [Alphaproteobacteria bacterium]|jgi:GTP-binding protein HflX|nr:GTPase HflX [Alphaproteobacteria bacterium]